jgi:hypothetical protein
MFEATWHSAGYIQPLTDIPFCKNRYPAVDDLLEIIKI